ncbi:MAG: LysR family transcriptional regulator [Parasporobacterium sp.]|nr:LysR family transcriptional regulator [Parasporobacterium sp.]
MTLLSYQVFKAVVEQGSFMKAAGILGITPSAVSHAIASMEDELGTTLFIRSRTGNSLTNFGRELLPYINSVLNSEESLRQAVSELSGPKQGRIKLGTFSSVCTNWIPDIIRSFTKENPNVTIDVYEGSYGDNRNWLRSGIVDFAFISLSAAEDLAFEPLYKDPLVCITPADFKKSSSGQYIEIDDIRDMSFIMLQESVDTDIKNFLRDNRITYSTRGHIEDDLSALVMVESGFGCAIMPEMVLKGIPYNVNVYHFENPGYRIIGLTSIDRTVLSPAARTLYNHIIKMYKTDYK